MESGQQVVVTKMIASYNPSNGEKLAEFVDATNADVDRAVEAAQKAFFRHGKMLTL